MFFCDVFTKTEGMDLQRGHASWNGGAPLSSTGQAMGDCEKWVLVDFVEFQWIFEYDGFPKIFISKMEHG